LQPAFAEFRGILQPKSLGSHVSENTSHEPSVPHERVVLFAFEPKAACLCHALRSRIEVRWRDASLGRP
jgi:hypothetical protein